MNDGQTKLLLGVLVFGSVVNALKWWHGGVPVRTFIRFGGLAHALTDG